MSFFGKFVIPIFFLYRLLFAAWRHLTGKSSVGFAWFMYVVVIAINIARDSILLRHYAIIWITLAMIVDGISVIVGWFITNKYQEFVAGNTEKEVLTAFKYLPFLVFYVTYETFIVYFNLLLGFFGGAINCALACVWAMSMCVYHPGGKTVWAKAKDKVVSMIPAPKPKFAPVGV